MPQILSWRTPRSSVSVNKVPLFFIPCRKTKTGRLIFFVSRCSDSSRQKLKSGFSGGNGLNCSGSFLITCSSKNVEFEEKGDANNGVSKIFSGSTSTKVVKSAARKQTDGAKCLFGSKKLRSVIILNIITVVYASNIPVVKEVEAFMDPAAFSAVRFTISAIPFLPFVFQARHDVKTRNAGLELGVWISLGYLIEALGLLTSEAGRASFLSLFTVFVVPFLECMLGAIVPARTWFGILMSVLGVSMLEFSGSPPNIGDLLNFLSAIFFGIHTLRTEHLSRVTKKENFMALLGYEVCVLAVLSTMWYILGGNFQGIPESDGDSWNLMWDSMVTFPWIPALYTGVFSTGLCLWAEIAAMRDVSATETAVIYGMEPLWGAGFAWFLLGERWGTAGWIGAALMLGGSLVVQMFGCSPYGPADDVEKNINGDLPFPSKSQNLSLTASPVAVRAKKNEMKL